MLCVTLIGNCIICLNPKVLHNSKYFFTSDEILLVPFTMFLLFSLSNVPFSHKLIFKSPSLCCSSFKIFSVFKLSDNVSRNLNWSGGMYIIPIVIAFVFGIRTSIKIFYNSFEMKFLTLKQILSLTYHTTPPLFLFRSGLLGHLVSIQ